MLELYHGQSSVCSVKVRLALEEKKIDWTSRHISLFQGENQSEEYLKINPHAKVPAIVHDGVALNESTVINEYLDDAFPEVPLKPVNPMERARMRLWTKQLDEGIHLAAGTISFCIAYRYRWLAWGKEKLEDYLENIPSAEGRVRSRDRVFNGLQSKAFAPALLRCEKMLADMEAALSEHTWLVGESYSLADAGFTPYVLRMDHLQLAPMWDKRPHVAAWYERVRARASFKTAVIDWYDEEGMALMEEKGQEEWPGVRAMLENRAAA